MSNKKVIIELIAFAGCGKSYISRELYSYLSKFEYRAINYNGEVSHISKGYKFTTFFKYILNLISIPGFLFSMILLMIKSKPIIKRSYIKDLISIIKVFLIRPIHLSKIMCAKDKSIYIIEDGMFQGFLSTVSKTKYINFKKYLLIYQKYFKIPDILIILDCDYSTSATRLLKRDGINLSHAEFKKVTSVMEGIKSYISENDSLKFKTFNTNVNASDNINNSILDMIMEQYSNEN